MNPDDTFSATIQTNYAPAAQQKITQPVMKTTDWDRTDSQKRNGTHRGGCVK